MFSTIPTISKSYYIQNFLYFSCLVPGCKSNYHGQDEFTSVFSFPTGTIMREKWFRAIPRPREDYEMDKHLKLS